MWDVAYEGDYIHFIVTSDYPNSPYIYKRGIFQSSGSIQWLTTRYIYDKIGTGNVGPPHLVLDDFNRPIILYTLEYDFAQWATRITRSTLGQGEWQTWSGFPKYFDQTYMTADNLCGQVIPLSGDSFYVVSKNANGLVGRFFDGSTFGDIEIINPDLVNLRQEFAGGIRWSGDKIYLFTHNKMIIRDSILSNPIILPVTPSYAVAEKYDSNHIIVYNSFRESALTNPSKIYCQIVRTSDNHVTAAFLKDFAPDYPSVSAFTCSKIDDVFVLTFAENDGTSWYSAIGKSTVFFY